MRFAVLTLAALAVAGTSGAQAARPSGLSNQKGAVVAAGKLVMVQATNLAETINIAMKPKLPKLEKQKLLDADVEQHGILQVSGCGTNLPKRCGHIGSDQHNAGVRCCFDHSDRCESVCSYHHNSWTHSHANRHCDHLGGRICSAAELASEKCCDSSSDGCSLDDHYVWTSDSCHGGTKKLLQENPDCEGVLCAAKSGVHANGKHNPLQETGCAEGMPCAERTGTFKLLQEGGCTAHGQCDDGEYCDTYNACFSCGACEAYDDAIDGQCPPCEDTSEPDEDTVCLLQNDNGCIGGLMAGILDGLGEAATPAAATELLDTFCSNCTGAADEFDAAVSACNITDPFMTQLFAVYGELLDNSCADTECAGATLWSFQDQEERADTFCANSECGLEIISPILGLALEEAEAEISIECVGGYFDLYCLTDSQTGDYCLQELTIFEEGEDGESTVAPFCGSSCAADLTLSFNEFAQLDCGLEELDLTPDCDLDYDFTLLDFCTTNANGDYCMDLFLNEESPDCEFDVVGVPAPAMESNETSLCPTECQEELEAYADTLGCCAGWSFDISCAPEEIEDFITDVCGISLGAQCDRPVLPASTASALTTVVAFLAATISFASHL